MVNHAVARLTSQLFSYQAAMRTPPNLDDIMKNHFSRKLKLVKLVYHLNFATTKKCAALNFSRQKYYYLITYTAVWLIFYQMVSSLKKCWFLCDTQDMQVTQSLKIGVKCPEAAELLLRTFSTPHTALVNLSI